MAVNCRKLQQNVQETINVKPVITEKIKGRVLQLKARRVIIL